MTRFDSRVHPAGWLPALVLLVSCGSDKQDTEKDIELVPVRPQISSFVASPASVLAGEPVTLAWTTRDVVSLILEDDAGMQQAVDGIPVEKGSIEITPTRTTGYTLTAFGPEGSPGPDERTVTVRVDQPEIAPVIESFSASPAGVLAGGEVTLSWRTTGATALTLKDDAGEAIEHDGSLENGSVTVTPTRQRTVYTLVATGNGRQAVEQIAVDVLGLPRIHQFLVQPNDPVVAGTAVTLQWETSRADRIVISDDAGATIVDTSAPAGSHSPTPTRTTEYTLTASGNGATSTAKVMARVGARIEEFTAFPLVARAGDPIALSWKTGDADSIIITAPGGFSYLVPPEDRAEGSTIATLVESGDFALSARIGTVVQDWAIPVAVTQNPRIRSFTANAGAITAAPDHPNHISLVFEQQGGTSCFLYRNGEAVPEYSPFDCDLEQPIEVELNGPADLRLVVANHAGNDRATVHIDAVEPARIVSWTKTPERRLAPGGSVELAWQVTGAVAVRLERDGADVGIGAAEFTGIHTATIQQTTVFRLVAENSLGYPTAAEQTVRAGAPEILAFRPVIDVVAPGDHVRFEWTCDGGDLLVLADARGEEKARTDISEEIDAGSSTIEGPPEPGLYEYTLTVRNGAGQEDVASFDLIVTGGPVIRSFTAAADVITFGDPLELSWVVTDDANGQPPVLTLEDNFGTEYELKVPDVHEASIALTPQERGTYVFRLTAASEGTEPFAATVEVEVADTPKITAFTADPQVLSREDSPDPLSATLAWETEHAFELAIYEADADGVAIPPAVIRISREEGIPQAELDRGDVVAHPATSTRYLLQIRNALGATTEKLLMVLIDPVEILTFASDPSDIRPGQPTTLSWTTVNATWMMMQPMEPNVTTIPGGDFVDISEQPEAQEVTMATTNDAFTVVAFPPDFRFPFDGELHAGVFISMNGFLGFDLDRTSGSGSNQTLPTSASYAYVHLAPFWDTLQSYSNGKLYTLYDETDRTFTVMWKNWSYRLTSATFDLNFEVILHENGDFEYRYGRMLGEGSGTAPGYAACSSCTIGFQDLSRSSAVEIQRNSQFPEGASDRGWLFEVGLLVNGSKEVTPAADQTYRLTAMDPYVSVSEEITVHVWPIPTINLVSIYPSGPTVGEPFTISWQVASATRVRLFDENGEILCEETDRVRIASGDCERTEETPGNRNYTLEAINGIEESTATSPLNFAIWDPLSVDSFSASKTFIESGESIELRWTGKGGFEAELFECFPGDIQANCARVDIRGEDPNNGSYSTANLTGSTEYRFQLLDRTGRADEASATVWVDIPKITSLTVSPSQTVSGEEVIVSWAFDGGHAALAGFKPGKITEVFSSPYRNISSSGEKAERTIGNADNGRYQFDFPDNFRFPYFGEFRTGISVRTDGWAGFNKSNTNNCTANDTLPFGTCSLLHIAPFWDDLKVKEGELEGAIYYKLETIDGQRALIIQWTHLDFVNGNHGPADLNFQAVLFASGHIEYRYGEMYSESEINPDSAAGKFATIGAQHWESRFGVTLYNAHNTPVPGGLQGRSWRIGVAPETVGSIEATPTESTTYRLCVNNESHYEVCEETRVVVVNPGDVMISEVMVQPSAVSGEWFEVRNLGVDPIDLAGFEILSNPEEKYSIPGEPALVIPPGAYAVLARSGDFAHNGIPMPDVVYGEAINLADGSDELVLRYMGVTIDRLGWTGQWPFETDRSMMLEPSMLDRRENANDSLDVWCMASEVYYGGFAGHPRRLKPGCLDGKEHAYYLLDPASDTPFIDISETGRALHGVWSDPYYSPPIPLGFTFVYFGDPVTEVTVLRNGALAMTRPTGSLGGNNSDIPSATTQPNGLIGVMWDQMLAGLCQYRAAEIDGRQAMIVQWTDVALQQADARYGRATFQVQLWEDGDIVFAYGPVQPSTDDSSTTYIYGANATIGLENIPADMAYRYYYGPTNVYQYVKPVYPGKTLHFHAK